MTELKANATITQLKSKGVHNEISNSQTINVEYNLNLPQLNLDKYSKSQSFPQKHGVSLDDYHDRFNRPLVQNTNSRFESLERNHVNLHKAELIEIANILLSLRRRVVLFK
jgi:uncharacterized DUF497 family protein